MNRRIFLILSLFFLAALSAPAQTILGKSPFDKMLDVFFIPQSFGGAKMTNADTIVKGINGNATLQFRLNSINFDGDVTNDPAVSMYGLDIFGRPTTNAIPTGGGPGNPNAVTNTQSQVTFGVYPLGGSGPFTRTIEAEPGDNSHIVVDETSGERLYVADNSLQLSITPAGVAPNLPLAGPTTLVGTQGSVLVKATNAVVYGPVTNWPGGPPIIIDTNQPAGNYDSHFNTALALTNGQVVDDSSVSAQSFGLAGTPISSFDVNLTYPDFTNQLVSSGSDYNQLNVTWTYVPGFTLGSQISGAYTNGAYNDIEFYDQGTSDAGVGDWLVCSNASNLAVDLLGQNTFGVPTNLLLIVAEAAGKPPTNDAADIIVGTTFLPWGPTVAPNIFYARTNQISTNVMIGGLPPGYIGNIGDTIRAWPQAGPAQSLARNAPEGVNGLLFLGGSTNPIAAPYVSGVVRSFQFASIFNPSDVTNIYLRIYENFGTNSTTYLLTNTTYLKVNAPLEMLMSMEYAPTNFKSEIHTPIFSSQAAIPDPSDCTVSFWWNMPFAYTNGVYVVMYNNSLNSVVTETPCYTVCHYEASVYNVGQYLPYWNYYPFSSLASSNAWASSGNPEVFLNFTSGQGALMGLFLGLNNFALSTGVNPDEDNPIIYQNIGTVSPANASSTFSADGREDLFGNVYDWSHGIIKSETSGTPINNGHQYGELDAYRVFTDEKIEWTNGVYGSKVFNHVSGGRSKEDLLAIGYSTVQTPLALLTNAIPATVTNDLTYSYSGPYDMLADPTLLVHKSPNATVGVNAPVMGLNTNGAAVGQVPSWNGPSGISWISPGSGGGNMNSNSPAFVSYLEVTNGGTLVSGLFGSSWDFEGDSITSLAGNIVDGTNVWTWLFVNSMAPYHIVWTNCAIPGDTLTNIVNEYTFNGTNWYHPNRLQISLWFAGINDVTSTSNDIKNAIMTASASVRSQGKKFFYVVPYNRAAETVQQSQAFDWIDTHWYTYCDYFVDLRKDINYQYDCPDSLHPNTNYTTSLIAAKVSQALYGGNFGGLTNNYYGQTAVFGQAFVTTLYPTIVQIGNGVSADGNEYIQFNNQTKLLQDATVETGFELPNTHGYDVAIYGNNGSSWIREHEFDDSGNYTAQGNVAAAQYQSVSGGEAAIICTISNTVTGHVTTAYGHDTNHIITFTDQP